MIIGKFEIGQRYFNRDRFYFFYCPLLKSNRVKYFHFFFWIGRKYYISWHK